MAINFPDSPSNNDSFSAGGKTWVYNGTKWVLLSVSLSQTVADGAITTAKLAADSVTSAKIAAGAVGTTDLAANAVTQAKLAANLSAVTVTTTANRDTDIPSPFTGQLAILTDTSKVQLYNGTAWVNISLAPPETPTSLSATALSTTSVSIAFTAGGANGSPITNYKYALSTDSGSTYGSFTALSPAEITSPITISGLSQNTAYYIKLKAVNDMGDSVTSAAVSITTLNLASAPTSLSATPAPTTVDISFTAGSQGGSAITNYQYALSTDSGSTYGSFTALATPDATSPITITGLTTNTAYYIKLKAVNTEGAGVESSAVSFTTLDLFSVGYLVVAGGAAGGGTGAGGGGAGGLRSTVTATGGGGSLETALSLTPSANYTVTVGSGGSFNYQATGSNGNDSTFSTVTSIGGGGGAENEGNGEAGGSGGGGASKNGAAPGGYGGAGTANQGFAGGNGVAATYPNISAGGGGGAGVAGTNGGGTTGGSGGNGVATSITGSSVTYAGGGGGWGTTGGSGAGGSGGGGAGAGGSGTAVSGTANTGGGGGAGGGGAYGTGNAGNGGSGVVILRYGDTRTITIGAGLTGSTSTDGSDRVTTITAGTGNVSWA